MSALQTQAVRPPAYTSIDGAAGYLSVSSKTIRRRIEDGTLQANRVGTKYVIAYADLDRLVRGEPSQAGQGADGG
jgi:excisionase family DNA binding protein